MRKFICFCLCFVLFGALIHSEEHDVRAEFLLAYHSGDYEKAHERLKKGVFHDPTTISIWEERIHQQAKIENCDHLKQQPSSSIQAMARLRIGELDQSKQMFQKDWISLWGLATLSLWENDFAAAHSQIEQALALNPERPELLYFAAHMSNDPEKAIGLFKHYLSLPTEEPEKRRIAEYSIQFMEKTKGIPLNVVWMPSTFTKLHSDFAAGRLTVKGNINGKNVNLMVDTGAGGLTLEEKKWEPKIVTDVMLSGLGKNEMIKAKRAVFDEFSTGKISVRNPVAAVSTTLNIQGIDGITGTVLFGDYLILLSLKSGKDIMLFLPTEDPFAVLEKEGVHLKKESTLPFRFVDKMIILKGRIKNSPEQVDMLLDTGAQRTVISTAAAKKYARINYFLSMQMNPSVVGVGGKTDTFIAENVEVQFGTLKRDFPQMLTLNLAEVSRSLDLDLDMLIGRDFLDGYSLLIDYHNRTVTFLK